MKKINLNNAVIDKLHHTTDKPFYLKYKDNKFYATNGSSTYIVTDFLMKLGDHITKLYSLPNNTNHIPWTVRHVDIIVTIANFQALTSSWSKHKHGQLVHITKGKNNTCTI